MAPALLAVPIFAVSMTGGRADPEPVADRSVQRTHRSAPGFRIAGKANGLYPGARRLLHVQIRNRTRFSLVVTRLAVAAVRGDADCPGTVLRTRPYRGSRVVRPRRAVTIPLTVRMIRSAPDGCQGTRFHLTYRGKATRR